MAVTSVEVQDRLVSRMMVLWSAKLERVEVLINNTGITLGDYYRCLSVEEVEAWTGRIKKSLLPIADAAEMDGMDEDLDAELDAICGDDSD